MSRRALLHRAILGAEGLTLAAALSACSTSEEAVRPSGAATSTPEARRTILLAYFSRPGENYWYGGRRNLRTGNTEILARMIRERLDCDVHRILAARPYPRDYEQTVERNVREQDADERPEVANPLRAIDRYDTILLASPIWNVRAPMIMTTFTESYDFTDKTVHPITTHAMSGLGNTEEDYARTCRGARIGAGLAIQGETVRDASAEGDLEAWLSRVGLG
ncbi:flavodoxin [Solirubrobacter pauli]|uniref:Flavodoxin n=2 Tax=Solirubrobacter pauli TaxID=166793 RepID=A0A660LGF0_9ACTN|nr:flavodoxin [Solirubrobacter pauli]